jgi:hypothetical protein
MTTEGKRHALLGPSGAQRWSTCAASSVYHDGVHSPSSKYSLWGVAAHAVLEMCFADPARPANAEAFVGHIAEAEGNEITVDMEMADCVNTCVEHIEALTATATYRVFETEVGIEHITGETGAVGTADHIAIVPLANGGDELVVVDFKAGAGVLVEAEGNLQLAMYALGALNTLDVVYDIRSVRLVIVQPRMHNTGEWVLPVDALRQLETKLQHAAKRSLELVVETRQHGTLPAAEHYQPSEKACRFCVAKASCPALRGFVLDAVTMGAASAEDFANLVEEKGSLPKALSATVNTGADISDADLGQAMSCTGLVETWIKAIRAEVESRLLDGRAVPGWKLVAGRRGARRWTDTEAAAKALTTSGRLKTSEAYVSELISPTVAEKLLADRPRVWAKLEPLITCSEGRPSVAPSSSSRPAWTPISATDFDAVEDSAASETD